MQESSLVYGSNRPPRDAKSRLGLIYGHFDPPDGDGWKPESRPVVSSPPSFSAPVCLLPPPPRIVGRVGSGFLDEWGDFADEFLVQSYELSNVSSPGGVHTWREVLVRMTWDERSAVVHCCQPLH
ncbi:hypothetical protein M427DRAFT_61344 [Gonapodya prolifera JEL478]|uniref:Uncharacterized protein n=1 Tax=Gonapodya prolifera (strain JEL478) TaxID=1344416 RepID=A0A139A2M0_GONPJ|nr:hypothetical protein M427DRAFT_61344 [Gonapodya prolifera JEL478]|eukprot:KXS10984.1 hypothetical protein M427DRAFT_61344 [Gonapodya prolifera JEL478]